MKLPHVPLEVVEPASGLPAAAASALAVLTTRPASPTSPGPG